MTREEIARALRDIEQAREERVEVWRVIINPDGTETGRRIYRGSFQRDPQMNRWPR
jgi:hypothetical protein